MEFSERLGSAYDHYVTTILGNEEYSKNVSYYYNEACHQFKPYGYILIIY